MPTSSMTTVSLPAASTQLLVSNSAARIGLMFTAPPSNRYTIGQEPTVTQDVGINFFPLGIPLVLTDAEHGEMVKRAWYAITPVAQSIAVFEWFA